MFVVEITLKYEDGTRALVTHSGLVVLHNKKWQVLSDIIDWRDLGGLRLSSRFLFISNVPTDMTENDLAKIIETKLPRRPRVDGSGSYLLRVVLSDKTTAGLTKGDLRRVGKVYFRYDEDLLTAAESEIVLRGEKASMMVRGHDGPGGDTPRKKTHQERQQPPPPPHHHHHRPPPPQEGGTGGAEDVIMNEEEEMKEHTNSY
eukprot:Trichotokara_eunicae@DN4506_c0_g1_i4.p1